DMEADLRKAGFTGEVLISTSIGGCMHASDIADRPVHTVKSGPAMAPVAGRIYAGTENLGADLLVCDSGGTTFDVGLVRSGELVFTRDTWLGRQWIGDLVSMSTVDVRSVGAGGGSIAWVDSGGLLRVGPRSAGSVPGPACYGQGGAEPTVTDAAVVLGYMDPDYFVGGRMKLDPVAAREAIDALAAKIGRDRDQTAYGIITIANELMIRAIQEITVIEGIDPRESVIVAGGGAAGLNIFPIAQELGCERVLLPETASALSACGMQFADIMAEQSGNLATRSDRFDGAGVNALLSRLASELKRFAASRALEGGMTAMSFFVEARYEFQVWDLEIPLPAASFDKPGDVEGLVEAFHVAHERVFAVRDEDSVVEFVNWKARLTRMLENPPHGVTRLQTAKLKPDGARMAYFGETGRVETPIYKNPQPGQVAKIEGPAIIEMPMTTIVVYPGMTASTTRLGNFLLTAGPRQPMRKAANA
ncbi:MAG: hydantoinase/oxoprolinase family protein, partial [Hyphomicrobiales bacterium]